MFVKCIHSLIPWVFAEHPLGGRHWDKCDKVVIETMLPVFTHILVKTDARQKHRSTG